MQKLRVGIAGASTRGQHLCHDFSKLDNIEIVAVMDTNQEALKAFQRNYSIQYLFSDYEEMLNLNLDIIVIASPVQFHAEQAIKALDNDIHVLSEVTAATNLEDCQRLLHATRKSKAQYMLAENYCYIRENIVIRNMVRNGLFGDIYFAEGEYIHNVNYLNFDKDGYPTWRSEETSGKRGITYGSHSLGPILEWFDCNVQYVNCLGTGSITSPLLKNDDTTVMLCRTKNESLIKIRVDLVSNRPHNMRYYSLQGTKACYEGPKFSGDGHRVWLNDYSGDANQWQLLSGFYKEFLPEELLHISDEVSTSHHWGADYFMVKDFVKSITENSPVRIGIDKALAFTIPGILSEVSINNGGIPVEVPDIQTW
ncbi:Gfo/Idh/MocA family protein [Oceanobacillus jeddahense]|uniref:Gfo/Idh/MocA family protein n=1 Tax=Oceanobacillus jeddahense TaxID=1462527 RepID=UPI000595BC3E|nr:Gfo/Idh/MocA family oxidoreductase [Oceanobacillus jeddahense]